MNRQDRETLAHLELQLERLRTEAETLDDPMVAQRLASIADLARHQQRLPDQTSTVPPRAGRSFPPAVVATDSSEAASPWRVLYERGAFFPRIGSAEPPVRGPFGHPGRPKILFVGHIATRTGAPLILLRLIEHLAGLTGAEPYLFLEAGGVLVDEYRNFAHVAINDDGCFYEGRVSLANLIRSLPQPAPEFALCNSAGSWQLMGSLWFTRIRPIVALIHENPARLSTAALSALGRYPCAQVFPAEATRSIAESLMSPFGDRKVLPQGLLKTDFAKQDHATARSTVRRHLGVPADTRIVLGCGSRDLRKGVDLFVQVADLVNRARTEGVKFVWLGGTKSAEMNGFVSFEIAARQLEDAVTFLDSVADPEDYFMAADFFLLTSRDDPFPCVVHEAMAAALPIIVFETSGGAREALAENSGVVVPGLDVAAMGEALLALLDDPAKASAVGDRAEARVRSRYRFDDYAIQILEICSSSPRPSLPIGAGRTPKLLFAQRGWSISGIDATMERLIPPLRERGIDAQFLFLSLNREEHTFAPRIPSILLDVGGRPWHEQWRDIEAFLLAEAPCILVTNFDYRTSAISPRLPADIGIVGTIHSDDAEHYNHGWRLGRYWNRTIAVSLEIARKAEQIAPECAARIAYIPNPAPRTGALPRGMREAGLPLRIVYSGRLEQFQKRVLDVVEIAHLLSEIGVDFQLTIVGDGNRRSEMEAGLRYLISDGRVLMTGRLSQENTADHLAGADILLLTSDYEGMPTAVLEGMAFGCVPVVSDTPSGIPELIRAGENGLLVPVGDIIGFAKGIAGLHKDRVRLNSMSAAAQLHVERNFSLDSVADQYASLFHSVWREVLDKTFTRPPSTGCGQFADISLPPQLIQGLKPP